MVLPYTHEKCPQFILVSYPTYPENLTKIREYVFS